LVCRNSRQTRRAGRATSSRKVSAAASRRFPSSFAGQRVGMNPRFLSKSSTDSIRRRPSAKRCCDAAGTAGRTGSGARPGPSPASPEHELRGQVDQLFQGRADGLVIRRVRSSGDRFDIGEPGDRPESGFEIGRGEPGLVEPAQGGFVLEPGVGLVLVPAPLEQDAVLVVLELAELGVDAGFDGPLPEQAGAEGVDRPDERPFEAGQGGVEPLPDPGSFSESRARSRATWNRPRSSAAALRVKVTAARVSIEARPVARARPSVDQAFGFARTGPGLDQERRPEVAADPVAGDLVGRAFFLAAIICTRRACRRPRRPRDWPRASRPSDRGLPRCRRPGSRNNRTWPRGRR